MTINELIEVKAKYAINEFTGEVIKIDYCSTLNEEPRDKPNVRQIVPPDADLPPNAICGLLFDENTVDFNWTIIEPKVAWKKLQNR